jgi:hypothetical protein
MANKRIELEQYKSYVDLVEEDPNRKTVRRGLTIVFISALLLIAFMFAMGVLSGNLAKNPRNVLEKPSATGGQQMPGGQQFPGGGQIPGGQPIPVTPSNPGGQQVPSSPGQGGLPMAPDREAGVGVWDTGGPSIALSEGALLALQAQPEGGQAPPVTVPSSGNITTPEQSTTQAPATKEAKKPKKKGPGKETNGVGNLAKLVNGVGGRGFTIYILVLSIVLAVFIYMAMRQARKEGKAR